MDEGSCSLTGDIASQGVRGPEPIILTQVAMDFRLEGLERLQLGHRFRKHVLRKPVPFIHYTVCASSLLDLISRYC